jgi:hypothetical protein
MRITVKSLFTFYLLLFTVFSLSCGSPPSRPESLWDSFPTPEENQAKQAPAKVWEGEEGNHEEPEEEAQGGGSSSSVPEEEVSGEEVPEIEGTVVINEIYYDAVGSDTDGLLFVELYGTPGLPIGNYKVNFVDGGDGSIDDSTTLPEGAIVPSDGFYLIADAKTGSPTESNVSGADLIDNFDPQNGPDAVQLLDSDGNLVDAVGYGEGIVSSAENGLACFEGVAAPDVVNGHSLERKEPGVDSDNNLNDFAEREIPTPGQ